MPLQRHLQESLMAFERVVIHPFSKRIDGGGYFNHGDPLSNQLDFLSLYVSQVYK